MGNSVRKDGSSNGKNDEYSTTIPKSNSATSSPSNKCETKLVNENNMDKIKNKVDELSSDYFMFSNILIYNI